MYNTTEFICDKFKGDYAKKKKCCDIITNIDIQKRIPYIAFIFYPIVGMVTKCKWMKYYSFVCSSFHLIYAYNLEKQLSSILFDDKEFDKYDGYKLKISRDTISFELPNIYNFYYITYDKKYSSTKNMYVNLSEHDTKIIDNIMEYRRYRFCSTVSVGCVFLFSSIPAGPITGILNTIMFCFILSRYSARTITYPKENRFDIKNKNYTYAYVDFCGNIQFSNCKYGFRKKYEIAK